jgi:hypothetical protein
MGYGHRQVDYAGNISRGGGVELSDSLVVPLVDDEAGSETTQPP